MSYKIIGLKGQNELNKFATKKEAIEWVSEVLHEVKDFSLLNALNEIQGVCKAIGPSDKNGNAQMVECFPNKYEMPLLLINLVLKEHGIRIDGAMISK